MLPEPHDTPESVEAQASDVRVAADYLGEMPWVAKDLRDAADTLDRLAARLAAPASEGEVEAAARAFIAAEDELVRRRATLLASPSEWLDWVNEATVEASRAMVALRAALSQQAPR